MMRSYQAIKGKYVLFDSDNTIASMTTKVESNDVPINKGHIS